MRQFINVIIVIVLMGTFLVAASKDRRLAMVVGLDGSSSVKLQRGSGSAKVLAAGAYLCAGDKVIGGKSATKLSLLILAKSNLLVVSLEAGQKRTIGQLLEPKSESVLETVWSSLRKAILGDKKSAPVEVGGVRDGQGLQPAPAKPASSRSFTRPARMRLQKKQTKPKTLSYNPPKPAPPPIENTAFDGNLDACSSDTKTESQEILLGGGGSGMFTSFANAHKVLPLTGADAPFGQVRVELPTWQGGQLEFVFEHEGVAVLKQSSYGNSHGKAWTVIDLESCGLKAGSVVVYYLAGEKKSPNPWFVALPIEFHNEQKALVQRAQFEVNKKMKRAILLLAAVRFKEAGAFRSAFSLANRVLKLSSESEKAELRSLLSEIKEKMTGRPQ